MHAWGNIPFISGCGWVCRCLVFLLLQFFMEYFLWVGGGGGGGGNGELSRGGGGAGGEMDWIPRCLSYKETN